MALLRMEKAGSATTMLPGNGNRHGTPPLGVLRVSFPLLCLLVLLIELLLNFLKGPASPSAEIAPGMHNGYPRLPWALLVSSARTALLSERRSSDLPAAQSSRLLGQVEKALRTCLNLMEGTDGRHS